MLQKAESPTYVGKETARQTPPSITIHPWMSVNLGLKQPLLSVFAFVYHHSPDGSLFDVSLPALAACAGIDERKAIQHLYNLNTRALIELPPYYGGTQCRAIVCNEDMARMYSPPDKTPFRYGEICDNLHFPEKGLTVTGWMLRDKRLTFMHKLVYGLFYQINRNGNIIGTFNDLERIFAIDKKTAISSIKALARNGYIHINRMTGKGFVCLTRDVGLTLEETNLRLKVQEWVVNRFGIYQAAPIIFYSIVLHFRRCNEFSSRYTDFERSFGISHAKVNGYLTFLSHHGLLDVIGQDETKFTCRPLATDEKTAAFIQENPGKNYSGVTLPRTHLSSAIRQRVFDRDGRKCRWCGQSRDLTVDHIRPISRGGTNDITNLQTLCSACNSQKGNCIVEPDSLGSSNGKPAKSQAQGNSIPHLGRGLDDRYLPMTCHSLRPKTGRP